MAEEPTSFPVTINEDGTFDLDGTAADFTRGQMPKDLRLPLLPNHEIENSMDGPSLWRVQYTVNEEIATVIEFYEREFRRRGFEVSRPPGREDLIEAKSESALAGACAVRDPGDPRVCVVVFLQPRR